MPVRKDLNYQTRLRDIVVLVTLSSNGGPGSSALQTQNMDTIEELNQNLDL